MKRRPIPVEPEWIWPRADPAQLEAFDPATKQCDMNCGPHRNDPRSAAERKLLCDDCWPVEPKGGLDNVG